MKMTEKFLALVLTHWDEDQRERLRDYIVGVGLAFDPIPLSRGKTFEKDAWRSWWGDQVALSNDIKSAADVCKVWMDDEATQILQSDLYPDVTVKSRNFFVFRRGGNYEGKDHDFDPSVGRIGTGRGKNVRQREKNSSAT